MKRVFLLYTCWPVFIETVACVSGGEEIARTGFATTLLHVSVTECTHRRAYTIDFFPYSAKQCRENEDKISLLHL